MRYVSTRGRAPEQSFSEILLSGLAADGGLYVPASYPRIGAAELDDWRSLSYAELASAVIGEFADDFARDELSALWRAYTPRISPARRWPSRRHSPTAG
jgi:threonine synthase